MRLTAVFALMGVLLAFVGIALAARPLHTETQDCGSAGSFLLDGRVNEFVDPANPPTGVTSAEAKANNVQPCQQRAANRGWPAGILVVGGTFAALTALIAEVIVRATFGRRRTPPPPTKPLTDR